MAATNRRYLTVIVFGYVSSWNSAHPDRNYANTAPGGGAGRFYCFARD
jgi:hypothetical protein